MAEIEVGKTYRWEFGGDGDDENTGAIVRVLHRSDTGYFWITEVVTAAPEGTLIPGEELWATEEELAPVEEPTYGTPEPVAVLDAVAEPVNLRVVALEAASRAMAGHNTSYVSRSDLTLEYADAFYQWLTKEEI